MRTSSRLLTGLAAAALIVAACETDDTDPEAPTEDVEDTEDDTVGDDTVGEDETVDDEGTDEDEVVDDDATEDEDAADDEEALGDVELLALGASDAGEHVVNREGITVYVHALDELEDGQPTCTGDCAAVWRPVAALQDEPEVAAELDPELVGTVEREDAEAIGIEEQLTYNGYPLYTFASDAGPGDALGQELGDIWFVIDPAGEPVGEVPDEDELDELDMDEDAAEE